MAKINGKIILPSALAVVLISGLIGYGELKNKVSNLKEEDVEIKVEVSKKDTEIKAEVSKLEGKHDEDVKGIHGKLDTLVNLVQQQTFNLGVFQQKVQTTMEYIQNDVKEIRNQ